MYKKMLTLLLACILILASALPVCAAEPEDTQIRTVTVRNVKNLLRVAENCRLDSYSQNMVVSLQADLDLENADFDGIPIFCGRFEGNGHTIRGLNLNRDGSDQGFFRYLTETAVVKDLHLEGSVQPEGSGHSVGGFVGKNSGTVQSCSFSGTVSGKEYIGGIAGENTVTGIIEECHVNGSVFGGHFIGGIAGKNAGIVRSCDNYALINDTSRKNLIELTDITLDSVFHSEAANTVTDIGGIIGNNIGLIRNCTNQANVGYLSMGYNIGGIAGTQSGTVLDCENYGGVYGRKEVGGIVGQMEPSLVMEFEEDVLQILKRQLDGMGRTLNAASSNLQGAGQSAFIHLENLQEYMYDAKSAVKTLIPTKEEGLPDLDTIIAARNSIGSSMVGMSGVIDDMGAAAYSALGAVSTNLHALNDHINAMRTTLGNVSETLGGSVLDRSDEDTELDFSGKVYQCRNWGNIQADWNGGGITGAIALENDLDVEEDWTISGRNSLNFESELRAVILDCENSGTVSVGKQNAGGIVGYQSLGLVRMSRNTGRVDAENADYVGGISGRSMGFIRNSHANGELFGKSCVGGIAGSAPIVTDCLTLVRISGGVEKLGAVLGTREENRTEIENPVLGNYYLTLQADPGAIDGISYEGQAQPLTEAVFFQLEDLPELFRRVMLTFRYGNGMERKFYVDFGAAFPEEWIPPIPPKDGRQSYWVGLETADLSCVCFDMVFEQGYTTQITVLESQQSRDALPLLLLQGVFSENAEFTVQESEDRVPLTQGEQLLEVWKFRSTEPENQEKIRIQLPETADAEQIRLFLCGSDQVWRAAEHDILGRYAVVSLQPGDDAIAVAQMAGTPWAAILIPSVLTLLGVILISRKRKKQ